MSQIEMTAEEMHTWWEARKATNRAIEKEEFCRRFTARMIARMGKTFDDGDSIEEYADQAAPTYWEDVSTREEGPEDCADSDISYWGE